MKSPKEITISLPILGLTIGTRAMLAAGVALLVAEKMGKEKRCAAGWTLAAVGAATTVPLFLQIFGGKCPLARSGA